MLSECRRGKNTRHLLTGLLHLHSIAPDYCTVFGDILKQAASKGRAALAAGRKA